MINPSRATPIALTFNIAAATAGNDALGNAAWTRTSLTVPVIITTLNLQRLQDLQQALGVTASGTPVKIRVQDSTGEFPAELQRGVQLQGALTYAGKDARITIIIGAVNPHTSGLGLLRRLGQSVEGILTYV